MIESMQDYEKERYAGLEQALLERTAALLGREAAAVRSACLAAWQEALREGVRAQQASEQPLTCAYLSISLLNTSLLTGKPLFQMDFYDAGGAYGWPWARTRSSAAFLFAYWAEFTAAALDEQYFVRSRVPAAGIRALFWETADRLVYLFVCFAKYFVAELADTEAYQQLAKAPSFFVTGGMYLDWQEQLYGERPSIELFDRAADEDTRFRQFTGEIFRGREFGPLELKQCRFRDCLFADCSFAGTKLMDAQFQGCRFHQTVFRAAEIAGCLWQDCALRGCSFVGVQSAPPEDTDEYYAEAELRQCYLDNVQIMQSDFSCCRLQDSQVRRLVMTDTAIDGAGEDWAAYAGGDRNG